ncbi:MAG TPA: hypothetical protein VF503_15875 [Sphingobium sp.]
MVRDSLSLVKPPVALPPLFSILRRVFPLVIFLSLLQCLSVYPDRRQAPASLALIGQRLLSRINLGLRISQPSGKYPISLFQISGVERAPQIGFANERPEPWGNYIAGAVHRAATEHALGIGLSSATSVAITCRKKPLYSVVFQSF